jgi:hypothetical protein
MGNTINREQASYVKNELAKLEQRCIWRIGFAFLSADRSGMGRSSIGMSRAR